MTKREMMASLQTVGVRAQWYGERAPRWEAAKDPQDPDDEATCIVCTANGWPAWPDEISFKVVLDRGHWYIETWAPYRYHVPDPVKLSMVAALLFDSEQFPPKDGLVRLPEQFCKTHHSREIAPLP